LRIAPRNPDGHYLLGLAHVASGDPGAALPELTLALAANPRHGSALEYLGLAHLMLGQFPAAENMLAKAAALVGAPASVFMRLGVAILEQGRAAEALAPLRKALAQAPEEADCYLNLGRALAAIGNIDEAKRQFLLAYERAPARPEPAFNLGVVAAQSGELADARHWFGQAVARDPGYLAAQEELVNIALGLGRIGEAVVHLRALVAADPNNPARLSDLARLLFEVGQVDEAESLAKRAIELDARVVSAYSTRANYAYLHGDLAQTIAMLEAGYAQAPAANMAALLAYYCRYACDWEKWRSAWDVVAREIDKDTPLGNPFWMLCEPVSARQQLACATRWAQSRYAHIKPLPAVDKHAGRKQRRLRLGYLSSDLHEHATAYLIAEVLERHDRERFEVFAYSYGPEDNSAMRARLRHACEHFVDIAWDAEDDAARHIRDDRLDILVDLKGYTTGDRLSILAYRPCAIQMTWLGYPGTTGAPFIDYAIADAFVVPPEAEQYYSEKILRLPHCYQPNDRKRIVAAPLARADYGLADDVFVFCCFNQAYKITPEIFALWMRLLQQIANSVLWLFESHTAAKENLLAAAHRHGVDSARLIFAPRLPNALHLARYQVADLALDTFPYTSHTTMSDALWCGCPAIALCGETFASRVSGSLLTSANLPDLITHSITECEALTVKLAQDRTLLESVRERVAHARDESPLFDSAAFTAALEALYTDLLGQTA
jgi:predicted O-linked N-acetylglucosamine transferase (SPINDLY family)